MNEIIELQVIAAWAVYPEAGKIEVAIIIAPRTIIS